VPGVLLAGLALVQLIASWAVDRLAVGRDKKIFLAQVRASGSAGTELNTWFVEPNGNLGEVRTDTVLEMASLAATVRGLFVSHFVIVLVAIVNLVVVGAADDASLRGLRLAGAAAAGLLALVAGAFLYTKADAIKVMLPGESKYRRAPRTLKMRWSLLVLRLRSPLVTTPYLIAGFVASVLMIPVTVGL
jgi:hypothetical protein